MITQLKLAVCEAFIVDDNGFVMTTGAAER